MQNSFIKQNDRIHIYIIQQKKDIKTKCLYREPNIYCLNTSRTSSSYKDGWFGQKTCIGSYNFSSVLLNMGSIPGRGLNSRIYLSSILKLNNSILITFQLCKEGKNNQLSFIY